MCNALRISGLGGTPWASVVPYLDAAAKCRQFTNIVSKDSTVAGVDAGGGGSKNGEGRGAASHAVMLALPTASGDAFHDLQGGDGAGARRHPEHMRRCSMRT